MDVIFLFSIFSPSTIKTGCNKKRTHRDKQTSTNGRKLNVAQNKIHTTHTKKRYMGKKHVFTVRKKL